jgi:hypothetical protein
MHMKCLLCQKCEEEEYSTSSLPLFEYPTHTLIFEPHLLLVDFIITFQQLPIIVISHI